MTCNLGDSLVIGLNKLGIGKKRDKGGRRRQLGDGWVLVVGGLIDGRCVPGGNWVNGNKREQKELFSGLNG